MLQSVGTSPTSAFSFYAFTCLALSLNLLVLWVSSGTIRAKSGVAVNPEDGARYGASVSALDPPGVARLLRAHRNAEATIYPFLLLGLVYVLAGGGTGSAVPIFALFTVARIAHSIAYLRAMQPWRTIAFATSLLATVALMAALIYRLLTT